MSFDPRVNFSDALAPLRGAQPGMGFADRAAQAREQKQQRELQALQAQRQERQLQNQSLDMALRFAESGAMSADQIGSLIETMGGNVPTSARPLLSAVAKQAKQRQKAEQQQGQADDALQRGFSDRAEGLASGLEGPQPLQSTLFALRAEERLAGGPTNPFAQRNLQALTSRAAGVAEETAGTERRERRKESRAEARARRKATLGATEFERMNRILETGTFPDGTRVSPEQMQRIQTRMQKLSTPGGQFIQLPDGTIVASGGAGIAEATKTRAASLIDDRMQIGEAISLVNESLALAREEPGRAGITGSVVSGIQTATGVASDLASLFEGSKPQLVNELRSNLQNDVLTGRADQKLLDRIQDVEGQEAVFVLGEVLAYEVAKTLRGQGRLTVNDWENAHRIVNMRGIKSGDQAIERLRQVEKFLQKKANNVERKMRAQGVPLVRPGDMEDLSPAARRVLERHTGGGS